MPISTTTLGTNSPASGSSSDALPTSALGTQDFLKLLVAQLKNQDPLQPMDNTQMVTQLAQFSSLETLQGIQSSLDSSMGAQLLGQAMGLLGHTVTAQPSGQAPVTGPVQSVRLDGADVLLTIGSSTVHLSDVQEIQQATSNGG
jgi:flagellar basal-body rod modification protein FlgD